MSDFKKYNLNNEPEIYYYFLYVRYYTRVRSKIKLSLALIFVCICTNSIKNQILFINFCGIYVFIKIHFLKITQSNFKISYFFIYFIQNSYVLIITEIINIEKNILQ